MAVYWPLAVVPDLIDIVSSTLLVLYEQQLLIYMYSETSLLSVVFGSNPQHSTAQHGTARHSTAQHGTRGKGSEGGSQVLGGAGGEVQLSGIAQEVDGAMVEGVPRGRPGGALVINIRHAGVVGLVEALIEGNTALSTCHKHMP